MHIMATEGCYCRSKSKFTLENVCRLCLFSDFPMKNIFRTHAASGEEIYKVINYVLGSEITVDDPLPSNICQSCLCKITAYFTFKTNALSAKSQLLEMVDELQNGVPEEDTEYEALDDCEVVDDYDAVDEGEAVDDCEANFQEDHLENDVEELNVVNHQNKDAESESNLLLENVEGQNIDEAHYLSAVETQLAIKEEIDIIECRAPRSDNSVIDGILEAGEGEQFVSPENDQQNECTAAENDVQMEELYGIPNQEVVVPLILVKVESGSTDDVGSAEQFCADLSTEDTFDATGSVPSNIDKTSNNTGSEMFGDVDVQQASQEDKESDNHVEKLTPRRSLRRKLQKNLNEQTLQKECIESSMEVQKLVESRRPFKRKKEHGSDKGAISRWSESRSRNLEEAIDYVARGGDTVEIEELHEERNYLKCHRCGEKRETLDELKKHICPSHLSRSVKETTRGGYGHSKKKKFVCAVCDKDFMGESSLAKHIMSHYTSFNSIVTDNKTSSGFSLERHLHSHTEVKQFKCHLCDYRTEFNQSLKMHMIVHKNKEILKCYICGYGAGSKYSLKVHMRTHTGEKPFKCNVCDFSTTFSSSLKIHMRIHTGEKPYKCDFCDYGTGNGSALNAHLRTHAKEKLFQCNLCHHRARSSNALKQHIIRHIRENISSKTVFCESPGISQHFK